MFKGGFTECKTLYRSTIVELLIAGRLVLIIKTANSILFIYPELFRNEEDDHAYLQPRPRQEKVPRAYSGKYY